MFKTNQAGNPVETNDPQAAGAVHKMDEQGKDGGEMTPLDAMKEGK